MNAALLNDIAALQRLVRSQQSEIEHLSLLVEKYKRMLFGKSAEKFKGQLDQLELTLDEKRQDVAQIEAQLAARQSEPSPHRGREPLPAHLPRETIEHLPQAACRPACGGALKPLGEDVAEVLEYVPASFCVQRHVRPKLACARCDTIVQASAPSRPIMNGLAGPGLLAHGGLTCEMIVPRATRRPRRSGSRTHPTAKANIRGRT